MTYVLPPFEFRYIGIARPEAHARTRGTQRYPVTLRLHMSHKCTASPSLFGEGKLEPW